MPYVLSIALVVVGLLLLTVVVLRVLRVLRAARRFIGASASVTARLGDESGLLRARVAALGVAIRQRQRRRIES